MQVVELLLKLDLDTILERCRLAYRILLRSREPILDCLRVVATRAATRPPASGANSDGELLDVLDMHLLFFYV